MEMRSLREIAMMRNFNYRYAIGNIIGEIGGLSRLEW